jgi:hypothetical protein
MHVIPPVESMQKLGEVHGTFAFDASPKAYLEYWQPLTIEFKQCSGSKATNVPDLSENFGRLFLSERAYTVLKDLLALSGELLPVIYKQGRGYIFNPLKTVEEFNACDESKCVYDDNGNLTYLAIDESTVAHYGCLKTQRDAYKAMVCSEAVKQACESASLTGVVFHNDLANPIGGSFGEIH